MRSINRVQHLSFFGSDLPPKIVLHSNDVIFVGWMVWVGMLPDLRNNAPLIGSHESVTLTLSQAYHCAERQLLDGCLLVGVADYDGRIAANHLPDFGSAMVVLPRQAATRRH